MPIPVNWVNGPGGLNPDLRPWEVVRHEYRFVDELAALQPAIRENGNRERFAYWLNQFVYMRDVAHLACLWAEFNRFMDSIRPLADPALKAKLAEENVLPLRRQMIVVLDDVFSRLLATVSNSGEMGTIANWEQHILPSVIERPGQELEKILSHELTADAQPAKTYAGPARLIVPTVRTCLRAGEALRLKAMVLSQKEPEEVTLHWRDLGAGVFKTLELKKISRGVYETILQPAAGDLEYYLRARADERDLVFPATAPQLNQTVVVVQGK